MRRIAVAISLIGTPVMAQDVVIEETPMMCQVIGREASDLSGIIARSIQSRGQFQQYADSQNRAGDEAGAERYLEDRDLAHERATESLMRLSRLFSLAEDLGCDMRPIRERVEGSYRLFFIPD